MDLLGHIAAARHHLDRIEELHRHQTDCWSAQVRTPIESVLPSQLPERTLGPALRGVRDFLRRAPGQPVDPEFDRVVATLGIHEARDRADYLAGHNRPSDEIWLALRDMARNRRADMERAE